MYKDLPIHLLDVGSEGDGVQSPSQDNRIQILLEFRPRMETLVERQTRGSLHGAVEDDS